MTDDPKPFESLLEPPHVCPIPASWTPKMLWRCPDGHLWQCRRSVSTFYGDVVAWVPASWWQRLRYKGTKAKVAMAGENRRRPSVDVALTYAELRSKRRNR